MDKQIDIEIKKARKGDAAELAAVSERAFHSDIDHGAPGLGGPPGYNSANWQARRMQIADYYKVLAGAKIIGGLIIQRRAAREYEVGRLFIDPAYQGRGIGSRVMAFVEEAYPLTKRWVLDTPVWNQRTRRFYRRLGFVEIREDASGLVILERLM